VKVLVTGASGFIGGYVLEEIISRGHTPIAFDRHDKGFRPDGTELFLGDITDDVAITEAVAHADAFIHLAGVLGTQETIKNPNPAAYTNILGGLNLFKAAAQYHVPGVNIAVGNYWMNNTYSITKSTMERFAKMFNAESGTNITIVRALNAYGPRQVAAAPYGPSKVKKIMPAFVNAALDGKKIGIYGDGTQVMDMIYVADVAQVLVSALEFTLERGFVDGSDSRKPIFEAGSGNPTTVNEIAAAVLDVVYDDPDRGNMFDNPEFGGSYADYIEYSPMRPGEPAHSVVLGDPDTLNKLSLKPFTPLDEGVARTVGYFEGVRASNS
jgi:UDP-glucose 4-epimerase